MKQALRGLGDVAVGGDERAQRAEQVGRPPSWASSGPSCSCDDGAHLRDVGRVEQEAQRAEPLGADDAAAGGREPRAGGGLPVRGREIGADVADADGERARPASAAAVTARTTGSGVAGGQHDVLAAQAHQRGVAVDEAASGRAAHEREQVVGHEVGERTATIRCGAGEVDAVPAGARDQRRRERRAGVEQLAQQVALQLPLDLLLRRAP